VRSGYKNWLETQRLRNLLKDLLVVDREY
jgi:hypothetical protein